jgi:hypothetical protein
MNALTPAARALLIAIVATAAVAGSPVTNAAEDELCTLPGIAHVQRVQPKPPDQTDSAYWQSVFNGLDFEIVGESGAAVSHTLLPPVSEAPFSEVAGIHLQEAWSTRYFNMYRLDAAGNCEALATILAVPGREFFDVDDLPSGTLCGGNQDPHEEFRYCATVNTLNMSEYREFFFSDEARLRHGPRLDLWEVRWYDEARIATFSLTVALPDLNVTGFGRGNASAARSVVDIARRFVPVEVERHPTMSVGDTCSLRERLPYIRAALTISCNPTGPGYDVAIDTPFGTGAYLSWEFEVQSWLRENGVDPANVPIRWRARCGRSAPGSALVTSNECS